MDLYGVEAQERACRPNQYARQQQAITVGFLGFGGGSLGKMVDCPVIISSQNYGQIEDVHLILEHMISQYIRQRVIKEAELGEPTRPAYSNSIAVDLR